MRINPVRAGIVLGFFLALFHAAWAGLVAAGLAQPFMDFVFWAHFITPLYHIEPFQASRAAALIGLVFAMGVLLGTVGGVIWNQLARSD